jgi:hypothetical protein
MVTNVSILVKSIPGHSLGPAPNATKEQGGILDSNREGSNLAGSWNMLGSMCVTVAAHNT